MAFDTPTCLLLQWWIERCSQMRTPTQTCPACRARRNTSTCRKSRGYAASWQGSSPSTTHKPSPRTLAHPKWPNFPKTYVSLGGWVGGRGRWCDWLVQQLKDLSVIELWNVLLLCVCVCRWLISELVLSGVLWPVTRVPEASGPWTTRRLDSCVWDDSSRTGWACFVFWKGTWMLQHKQVIVFFFNPKLIRPFQRRTLQSVERWSVTGIKFKNKNKNSQKQLVLHSVPVLREAAMSHGKRMTLLNDHASTWHFNDVRKVERSPLRPPPPTKKTLCDVFGYHGKKRALRL